MPHGLRPASAVLALLLFLPSAAAVLVPDHGFSGEIIAPSSGDSEAAQHLALMTGALSITGTEQGVFSASGTTDAKITGIDRLEVFRHVNGKAPPSRPQTFRTVDLLVADDTTIVYFVGEAAHAYTVRSDFVMVVPLDPPDDYKDLKFEANTSLALVGGADLEATMSVPGDALLLTNSANASFEVVSEDGNRTTFEGKDWAFRVGLRGTLSLSATQLVVPFAAKDSTARLTPGGEAIAKERFDINQLVQAFQQASPDSTATPPSLDAGIADQFRAGAAIFDGVILGQPQGTTTLGGQARATTGFMLYRFDALELTAGETRGSVLYEGAGPFLLAGDALYTTKTALGPSAFSFPVVSLVLWVLAAGALVVGRFVQPFVPANSTSAAAPLRLTGILVRIGAGILVFVLWDLETQHFLGTSILGILFGSGSAQGVTFGAVLGVELITLSLAAFYFGLPIRFLTNTALKLGQLKRARGVGKGVGYTAAWGLGAAHFALLLNPFIGLFVDSLGQFP